MTERQDTVIWSTAQVIAWIRRHLDDGHTLRGRDADADESPAGRFVCSCGVTLEVRPLIASEVSAGVHIVTGPAPLDPLPAAGLSEIAGAIADLARLRERVGAIVARAGTRQTLTLAAGDLAALREALAPVPLG